MYRLRRYPNCFVGEDAVSFMVEQGICDSAEEAVALGNQMLDEGLLHHVCYEHPFLNERKFYRLVFKNAFADEEEMYELAERVEELEDVLHAELAKISNVVDTLDNLEITVKKLAKSAKFAWMVVFVQVTLIAALSSGFDLKVWATVMGIAASWWLWQSEEFTVQSANEVEEDKSVKGSEDKIEAVADTASTSRSREKSFDVSEEEVKNMENLLAREFKREELQLLRSEYIRSVMSKPNSKNKALRRSFDYSHKKLKNVVLSRRKILLSGSDALMNSSLSKCGSLYWHGYTAKGNPILWVRSKLKDWDNVIIEDELYLHMRIIDEGLKLLPKGINTFVIISDATGLGIKQVNPTLMRQLLNLLLKVYPDRLESLHAGPVNAVLR